MTEKKENIKIQSASGSAAGKPARPSVDEEGSPCEESTSVQEIPIGYPVDADEYRRLKEQAKRASHEEREEGEATVDQDMTP